MNKVEVKKKLKDIIREMLLADLKEDREIPQVVCDYILKTHGFISSDKSSSSEDLNGFYKNLQKWIEDSHKTNNHQSLEKPAEVDYDFSGVYKKCIEAESEYYEVTAELAETVENAMHEKVNYSQFFKDKCKTQESSMELLTMKAHFLKLQFFLKLYGEENALAGHIKLRSKLQEELDKLKKTYKDLVELNKQYDEIKSDKQFCELFNIYKELKKIEKRTEIMAQLSEL